MVWETTSGANVTSRCLGSASTVHEIGSAKAFWAWRDCMFRNLGFVFQGCEKLKNELLQGVTYGVPSHRLGNVTFGSRSYMKMHAWASATFNQDSLVLLIYICCTNPEMLKCSCTFMYDQLSDLLWRTSHKKNLTIPGWPNHKKPIQELSDPCKKI